MIQFAIPKAYVDNPEQDLPTGAPKGPPEGERKLFNAILATYLGELGERKDPHFGLEESAELFEEQEELEHLDLETSKMAWGLYNLGLQSQPTVTEEGEEQSLSVSGVNRVEVLSAPELDTSAVEPPEDILTSLSTEVFAPVDEGGAEVHPLPQTSVDDRELLVNPQKTEVALEQSLSQVADELPTVKSAPNVIETRSKQNLSGETVWANVGDERPVVKGELFTTSLRQSTQTKIKQALVELGLEEVPEPLIADKLVESLLAVEETPFDLKPSSYESLIVPVSELSEELLPKSDLSKGEAKIESLPQGNFENEVVSLAAEEKVEAVSPLDGVMTEKGGGKSFAEVEKQLTRERGVIKPKRHEVSLENPGLNLESAQAGSIQTNEGKVDSIQSKPVLDLRIQESVLPKITKQIETLIQNERTEVRIQLKPEHLGEMKIKLSLERGIMQAEFMVENEAVREVIASQLPQLQTALQDQGANVSQMMVNIDFGQSENEGQDKARPKQFATQVGSKTQGSTSLSGQTNRLSKNPWYQVDLKA